MRTGGFRVVLFSLLIAVAASGAMAATTQVMVYGLRCEYRTNPLGIDTLQPRLSWKLQASGRGRAQSAYQILVASSPESLHEGKGDLWDSGKVESSQSLHVPYAGAVLTSGQACWWKVRVWDERGQESAWSEPAYWSMGLLQPQDWTGTWIGLDSGHLAADTSRDVDKASWIWYPEGQPAKSAPPGSRYFRRIVELPADRILSKAVAFVSVDNEGSLFVNGRHVGDFNSSKTAVEFSLDEVVSTGTNILALSARNGGEHDNPAGLLAAFVFEYNTGDPVVVTTDGTWKAAQDHLETWRDAAFDDSAWVAAQVLGGADTQPWGPPKKNDSRVLPARMLRHGFDVPAPVKRATAYISGLGLSELYINGTRIGDRVLSPGLTEYDKRTFYVTYDVTQEIRTGKNAVGVWLGNGRYYAPRTGEPTATRTYGYPKLLFQLRLELADGSVQDVVSDESWKLTTDGPIRANNEYDGEVYDARMELPGWSEPEFDDAAWQQVQLVEKPGLALSAEMAEPIKVTEVIHPVTMTNPKPGMFIYDMGQNMVGWCRLRVSGPAGARVVLRHAEVLRDDGTLYLDNIRGAKVTDEYVLKGEGMEVWEPRFTYHGFRYVELTGYPGQPDLSTLEGCVVHDAVAPAGSFESSNQLLNDIYRNIVWGVRGNYRSIPTDCPQRDERQGWLGDRSEESRGEAFLFDIAALYAKWVADMDDAQRDDGSVSDVAPSYWPLYNDNVTWPSSFIIIPGMLYDQYGDVRVIERHYDGMRAWIKHMETYLQDDIMPRDNYGDWCVPPEEQHLIHSKDPARKTPGDFLGTSYFYHDLNLMARYADMLGKNEEAKEYRALAERLKVAFNKKFYHPDSGLYANGAATTAVLPIAFGLVAPEAKDRLFQHLVDKIMVENKGHTSTGLIGGQWLMRVLSDHGRPDVAYTIASKSEYPSWGYMLSKGATTIWELWNGDTADPAMNSHNHVMLVGDLTTWLYSYLGGIRPAEPGYSAIELRPTPVDGLDHVKVSWLSPHGQIFSQWTRRDGKFRWSITVPANTKATVYVPTNDPTTVMEGGRLVGESPGVSPVEPIKGAAVYRLGSGHYVFESKY